MLAFICGVFFNICETPSLLYRFLPSKNISTNIGKKEQNNVIFFIISITLFLFVWFFLFSIIGSRKKLSSNTHVKYLAQLYRMRLQTRSNAPFPETTPEGGGGVPFISKRTMGIFTLGKDKKDGWLVRGDYFHSKNIDYRFNKKWDTRVQPKQLI